MPEKIDPEAVAQEAGVEHEDAKAVLDALTRFGWLNKEYIIELPGSEDERE